MRDFAIGVAVGLIVANAVWLVALRVATMLFERDSRSLDYLKDKRG